MYDTKTTSGYSRARIEKLSVPKESKQEWATGFDSWQLRWGDKDSMWQITDAAKQARPKKRTLKESWSRYFIKRSLIFVQEV